MLFSYQIATPDLKVSTNVTCMQGDFRSNVKKLASYGYNAVEIMTTYPRSINWANIKQILNEYEMRVSLICTGELGLLGYTISDPDDRVRNQSLDRIKEMIDLAEYFQTGINIGNTKGRYRDYVPKVETYNRAVDGLKQLCDYAKPKGVDISVETGAFVYINFLNTCAEVYDMIRQVDRDNLGIMLDLWHLYVEEKSVIDAVREYGSKCFHVHLADSNRKYPGAGNMDFEKIIRAFKEAGYDRAFSVEVRQEPDSYTAAKEAASTLFPIFQNIYQYRTQNNAEKALKK